ncbi:MULTISPECIES: response regulator transcription factor [unclassified Rhizobium]|uniref:response regulator transcription factor n=1 Tax=unclassified Rhizobium TaxID=2613769 RepID=UPI000BDB8423|nr:MULTISPECIES: response regulator transcription factor [unclassified Rhizobium]MDH7810059.1 DNA-binding NarL/FixJ family response regulator [Rhizobium sp. AN67]MDQ4408656.1 response regulator transcription factor [Rhizobium sp. AN63]SOD50212.1 two component transcriptional regulator, LuxR family [Rhizobium sp. AN6A]
MKVLLADDHWIVRTSLKHAISSVSPSFEAIEASNFEEAMELLSKHPDTELMLVDLVMPDFAEFSGLRMLRNRYPEIPIVVISVHEERDHVLRAIAEGVVGYIPKSAGGAEVMRALKLVLGGDVFFPREILKNSQSMDQTGPIASGPEVSNLPLTPREDEVFKLASAGCSNVSIAQKLGMSASTVRVHLRNINAKVPQGTKMRLKRRQPNTDMS